jgi:hypothetical protein
MPDGLGSTMDVHVSARKRNGLFLTRDFTRVSGW